MAPPPQGGPLSTRASGVPAAVPGPARRLPPSLLRPSVPAPARARLQVEPSARTAGSGAGRARQGRRCHGGSAVAPCCPCVSPSQAQAAPRRGHRSRTGERVVPHALRYLPAAASPPSRSAVPSPARPAPLRAEHRRHGQRRDVTAGASGGEGAGLRRALVAPLALRRARGLRGCPGSASPPAAEGAQALRLSPASSALAHRKLLCFHLALAALKTPF